MFNADLEKTKQEYAEACKGIRDPVIKTLCADAILYRFASTKQFRDRITKSVLKTPVEIPAKDWPNGPWWVQRDDYRLIIQQCRAGLLSLGTVGRMALAVQPTFSNMDVSVKARLVDHIKVWVGEACHRALQMLPLIIDSKPAAVFLNRSQHGFRLIGRLLDASPDHWSCGC